MNLAQTPARFRLDAALNHMAITFRGMTAHPDEQNCVCHWGSAEELAQLKVPDVELDLDLLRRTWPSDWNDHASVLRRILPQLSRALIIGLIEPLFGMDEVGRAFARGDWQQWPTEQAAAVREFLSAWWANTLIDPDPTVPTHEVLALCTEASAAIGPWLHVWEAQTGTVSDHHLAKAVSHWEYDLLGDQLPWESWNDKEETRIELTSWLIRHAPARLHARNAPVELLHRIRLLGLAGPARWDDPHWPGHRY
ncbi:hypothetical protein [Planotetraspora kaengkrachanensis]|nr:hypothetical protein [Planotetraspora kaengkrachanensis]